MSRARRTRRRTAASRPAPQKEVVGALAAATRDEDSGVRRMALRGLMRLGPSAVDAVPELRRQMSLPVENGWDTPQRCAAQALMKMGPETKALVPPELAKRVEEYNAQMAVLGSDYNVDETKPKPKAKTETETETAAPGL